MNLGNWSVRTDRVRNLVAVRFFVRCPPFDKGASMLDANTAQILIVSVAIVAALAIWRGKNFTIWTRSFRFRTDDGGKTKPAESEDKPA